MQIKFVAIYKDGSRKEVPASAGYNLGAAQACMEGILRGDNNIVSVGVMARLDHPNRR